MHVLESMYKNMRTPVRSENRDEISEVIAQLYCDNMQSTRIAGGSAYSKLIWPYYGFLTPGCRRRMLLACFICKFAFEVEAGHERCCDNCMYELVLGGSLPEFDIHDVTARVSTN